jgi:hypothetical protein
MFAIVDEGPGLSGSSFASVVIELERLGVPCERIVLFPSWDPPPDALRSDTARDAWRRCRRYVSDAASAGVSPARLFGFAEPAVDWSGGHWREHVLADDAKWPAVQPQHERWKVHAARERCVLRFSGLGPYGRAVAERASRLADAGLAAKPLRHAHGFMASSFIDGVPADGAFSNEEMRHVGEYVGRRAAAFGWSDPVDPTPMLAMIETNVRELLDRELSSSSLARFEHTLATASTSDIDARMLPHEWLRTERGLRKTDAFDHGDDHFLPGRQSPLWDIAGAIVELQPTAAGVRELLSAYDSYSGEPASDRVTLYRAAYSALRGGYAAMAAETLSGTDDGRRFADARRRYEAVLMEALQELEK